MHSSSNCVSAPQAAVAKAAAAARCGLRRTQIGDQK